MIPDKRTLRLRMRVERERFAASAHPEIEPDAAFLERLSVGMTIASYVPIRGEADPAPLARAAVERGCVIALPHVTDTASPIRFLAWETEAALVSGPFGLSQPADDAAELVPDIILTPVLAFDAALNRLGQGAGHYDRAFEAHADAWRVGVAWSVQQIEALPREWWDVPLHIVATEKGWVSPA